MLRCLVIVIVVFLNVNVFSQKNEQHFIRHFSQQDGLTSGNIRKICEDTKGFIWIGTQDGLFRYDGKIFIPYNTHGLKKHQIGGADVRDIKLDSIDNKIWITTSFGGINSIDINTGNIIDEIKQDGLIFGKNNLITSLLVYKNLILITSENGLFYFYKKTKNIVQIPMYNTNNDLGSQFFLNALPYYNKVLLFTKKNDVYLFDISSKKILSQSKVAKKQSSTNIESIFLYDVIPYSENTFIASTNYGIYKVLVSENNNLLVSDIKLTNAKQITGTEVYALCLDKSNNLWLSNNKSVFRINNLDSIYTKICESKSKDNFKWLSSTYRIFCDSQNNIWFGCQNGVAYTSNKEAPFTNFNNSVVGEANIDHAYYLFPVSDSMVYACAANGLYLCHLQNGLIEEIDKSKSYDYVFIDPNGRTIVSNEHGLFVLKNKHFKPIKEVYPEFAGSGSLQINSSSVLNDSCIIFGTENRMGVIIWNYLGHIITNYRKEKGPIRLGEDIVNKVFSLGKNKSALLGDSYFTILDYAQKKVIFLDIKNKLTKPLSIFFDLCKIKENYYLASYGNGVIIMDSSLKFVDQLTNDNNLSNNGVYMLLPWKDSLLYISTNNGLNEYDIVKKKMRNYFESDGLHGSAFEETSGNTYNTKIFAGGANGFSIINPLNIKRNSAAPLCYFNKVIIETSNVTFDTSNLELHKLYIPSNTLQVKLYFSGISWNNPSRTSFAWRITERSNEWSNIGSQNFINIIGLENGLFHFQVKAANEDGVWSHPKEVILIFEPKWHQTWWFYLSIGLIVTAILYALYHYRISQIKKQHEIRKNIATDLHDDLGSTLNSVKVFTNLAISGVKQEESLQQVKDNLTEATMSLRDMIWVLDDSLDTVDELITRLKQFAIPVATASNMEAIIKADSEVNNRQLTKEEKRNLFLICKEAINNSIKYSGATKITVTIKPRGKKIQITVVDNGNGFNLDEVKKGYGLKNMQYRAGQVGYRVLVNSKELQGTSIEIATL